jgi:hypothetical protein
MTAVKDWSWTLPIERIRHYTRERQREVRTLGLSLSRELSSRLIFSGDMAVLDIASQATSADAQSVSHSPSEYFYHMKFTGEDFMVPGSDGRLDLRHSVSATSQTSSASLHTKYAINHLWNITPRLRTNYHKNAEDDSVHWVATPAVKMEYRWKQLYAFQIEAGGKWSSIANADAEKQHSSYFVSLGYQIDF